MESIIYVGIDVHKNSYTLCCLEPSMYGEDKLFAQTTLDPDSHLIEKYLDRIEENFLLQHPDKDEVRFVCGYEAGCMGYTLYYQLRQKGITCHVMAPSSMPRYQKHRIKTDRLDAEKIAKSLAYGTYSRIYIPSVQDDMIKQYIRMRDDHKKKFKMLKQEIQGLCLRNGQAYDAHKSYWTAAHLTWLSRLSLDPILKETLQEYLSSYRQLSDKLDAFDRRIEEFAQLDAYREKVEQLRCFVGIKTYSAMTILVETSDFQRFRTAAHYAAYLGLVPGEHSSGDTANSNEHYESRKHPYPKSTCRSCSVLYPRVYWAKVSRFTKTTRRKGARCYCVCGSCERTLEAQILPHETSVQNTMLR